MRNTANIIQPMLTVLVTMYVTHTKDHATDKAVLYLTDAFGLPLNENKL